MDLLPIRRHRGFCWPDAALALFPRCGPGRSASCRSHTEFSPQLGVYERVRARGRRGWGPGLLMMVLRIPPFRKASARPTVPWHRLARFARPDERGLDGCGQRLGA